jgi:hypothetical protein
VCVCVYIYIYIYIFVITSLSVIQLSSQAPIWSAGEQKRDVQRAHLLPYCCAGTALPLFTCGQRKAVNPLFMTRELERFPNPYSVET